ncbi:LemA family protein [Facklamia sp. 7083-14-GEN3]|uniref:LemA family protein n=1 Tax=Facklamia sp. 7083-14-GEN3 TaxID=2973478 RepID=UPI00215B95E5|nr:LemA family protein [Facklamia sp. 7083-14-GEN3]MCR8969542.1 LemA family protein [Facklamia sp. 7083-14-GEN3]
MFMYILLGIVVVVALFWVGAYNNLIKARNGVEGSFSQIDVQLQRRNDLIPNLVETVKGYAKHERETLENVTKARQQLINLPADASPEIVNSKSNSLTSALSRLLVVSEQYPDLKANSNFQELQRSLEDTENKIAVSRQLYNSSVQTYNEKVQVFPNNVVAGVHGFGEKNYLEAPEAARKAPQVSFN